MLCLSVKVNRYKNEHSEAEKWTREKHFNWDSKEGDTNPDPHLPFKNTTGEPWWTQYSSRNSKIYQGNLNPKGDE